MEDPTFREGGNEEDQWKWLFNTETLAQIRHSIAAMEEEIFSDFRVKLGEGVVMSHYWRLKFILSHSMNERDRYVELIRIMVGKFKDEVENNLDHMRSLLHVSRSPFQRILKEEDVNMEESNQVGVNDGKHTNDAQDEAELSRRC